MPDTATTTPTVLTLPVLPLTSGVVLPGMVLTIALETDEAKAAVDAAGDDGRLLLVPVVDGRHANVGTVATIESRGTTAPDGEPTASDLPLPEGPGGEEPDDDGMPLTPPDPDPATAEALSEVIGDAPTVGPHRDHHSGPQRGRPRRRARGRPQRPHRPPGHRRRRRNHLGPRASHRGRSRRLTVTTRGGGSSAALGR